MMKIFGGQKSGSWLQVALILILGFFFAQGGCESSDSDSSIDNSKYYGTYTIEVQSADKAACVGNRWTLTIGNDEARITSGTTDELKNDFYMYAGTHTSEYDYVSTKSGKLYSYSFKSDGDILEMTQEVTDDWKYYIKLRFENGSPSSFTATDDNRFADCGDMEGTFWKN